MDDAVDGANRLPNIQPVGDDADVKGGKVRKVSVYEPEPTQLSTEEPNKPMEGTHIIIKERKKASQKQLDALAKARDVRRLKKVAMQQEKPIASSQNPELQSKIAGLEEMVAMLNQKLNTPNKPPVSTPPVPRSSTAFSHFNTDIHDMTSGKQMHSNRISF
jgi:hypothetical protein